MNLKGDTPTSISARMGVARRQFYKHHKLWRSKGNEEVKIFKWAELIQSTFLHGSRSWHMTMATAKSVRTWGFQYLRNALDIRRRPGNNENGKETCHVYLQRAARLISKLMTKHGCEMLRVKTIRATFQEAWRERLETSRTTPLVRHKGARDRLWWDTIKNEPNAGREKGWAMQANTARTNEWEDPICSAIRQDWRHQRDGGMDAKGWKGITTMSIITLLTGWNMTMGKPEKPKVSEIKKRRRTENFLEPHPAPVLLEEED